MIISQQQKLILVTAAHTVTALFAFHHSLSVFSTIYPIN